MLNRLMFYPSLFYNLLMEKITQRDWYNIIDDKIIIGAIPFKSQLNELICQNVKGVISLNENHEFKFFTLNKQDWHNQGVRFLNYPIKDFVGLPSLQQIVKSIEFIDNFKSNDFVYIHCKAGRCRSAIIVTCYLMKRYGYNPEEAITYLTNIRPHVILNPQSIILLNKYYETLVHS